MASRPLRPGEKPGLFRHLDDVLFVLGVVATLSWLIWWVL